MTEEKLVLNIEGMQGEHCRRSVEEALKAVPGVRKAVVDLAGGAAEVVYEPAATGPEAIRKAVVDQHRADVPGQLAGAEHHVPEGGFTDLRVLDDETRHPVLHFVQVLVGLGHADDQPV